MQKASLVKGTRDFSPIMVAKKNYIFDIIKRVYRSYGFAPLETPSMETLETLTGKYGDEGDQLLFRILNNGDILPKAIANQADNSQLKNALSDKGLRYDLTVPFARYVAQNRHEVKMPFKRYQIQPVWRADRPQKGRYREFWQCDADTIGTDSLLCEVECLEMFDQVFSALKLPVIIHLNHRKLLEAIAVQLGFENHLMDFTVAIDKLDKIGIDGVVNELNSKGLPGDVLKNNSAILSTKVFNKISINELEKLIPKGNEAFKDFAEILNFLKDCKNQIIINPSLARGLSYYTGCIFEVKLKDMAFGSLAAGGRYDDLTAVFGVNDISGIGISFGADRIYDVLEDLHLFPDGVNQLADLVLCPMDNAVMKFTLDIAHQIRNSTSLSCIVYPKPVKLKKQLDYANAIQAKFALVIGDDEMNENKVTLKNLVTGAQETIGTEALINHLV